MFPKKKLGVHNDTIITYKPLDQSLTSHVFGNIKLRVSTPNPQIRLLAVSVRYIILNLCFLLFTIN